MGQPIAARAGSLALAVCALCVPGAGLAQAPGEVEGLLFADAETLSWTASPGADFYNVYRGLLSWQVAGVPGRCHGHPVGSSSFTTAAAPETGEGFFYLVSAESSTGGEGPPGTDSLGAPRPLLGRCGPTMRNHVLDRAGYGFGEWARDRIDVLGGLTAYLDEQLAPDTISEADNTELNTRLAPYDPPESIIELIAERVVSSVYSRRQLAEQVGLFWTNHFNTDWRKVADVYQSVFPQCTSGQPQCDPSYPQRAYLEASLLQQREFHSFRDLGFKGRFRKIVETSAMSPAMIIFLDTYTSIAGSPNENYARELLELYTMGVDGGYTQQDVEELARVFTGWTACKKELADIADPLAACITNYWEPTPVGLWVATFDTTRHDCSPKILFQGTPEQVTIGTSCGSPADQVKEVRTALDAIVAHPSTPRFISGKILERFVTDDPDPAMVDALVAVWNDAGNPAGVGDLGALLEAALMSPAFVDPDRVGSKIKTPFEQFVSAFRAVRGDTDGVSTVLDFLVRAQHLPFFNPVPTGWPEAGGDWLDTNNSLERQNFGIELAAASGANFGSDPIGLLVDHGVSTAPGNAEAIVDFLGDVMFGGALTLAERQTAIDFLNTDDVGIPGPYDDARIRDVVGLLLGYPQFQEQ